MNKATSFWNRARLWIFLHPGVEVERERREWLCTGLPDWARFPNLATLAVACCALQLGLPDWAGGNLGPIWPT